MLLVLNSLLATAYLAGLIWYALSSSEFLPALIYFMTLCIVASASSAALSNASHLLRTVAVSLNAASLALLAALLVAGFVLSPGSGVVALTWVFFPFVVNLATLKALRAATELES